MFCATMSSSTTCRPGAPTSTSGRPRALPDRARAHLTAAALAAVHAAVLRADQLFARLKATFGLHSHLLRVNSATAPSAPGFFPVGQKSRVVPTPPCYLTPQDMDGVASFVRDFLTQSLLPHLVRLVAQLNEQWGASRRGLTGRLFSAGKKYFGGSTPTPTSSSTSALPAVSATPRAGAAVSGGLYGQPSAASSSSSIASMATSASSIVAPTPQVT